jgi:hypothetical protein
VGSAAPPVDAMPLSDLIDEFRTACITAKVVDGDIIAQAAGLKGRGTPSIRTLKPEIDFDHCHALDFGYMFNIGGDKPEVLSDADVVVLQQTILRQGVHLPYPKMLFVERTSYGGSKLFITYVYGAPDGAINLEYYIKDAAWDNWFLAGRVDNVVVERDGLMTHTVKSWGLLTPSSGMPADDQNPVNHFVRMTVVLIGMLLRRGDDVEQVIVARDRPTGQKRHQRPGVESMSVIRLRKKTLIKNLEDEDKAVVVSRVVGPHDRAGTIAHRIKDPDCLHEWVEEYRDDTRWRNRCPKCDSCEFWRAGAKVKGGAAAITLHVVRP